MATETLTSQEKLRAVAEITCLCDPNQPFPDGCAVCQAKPVGSTCEGCERCNGTGLGRLSWK